MTLDPWTTLACVLMALATFACRGGGYWLFRQISPTPMVRSILTYVPGTLFVSYVIPAVVHGGLQPLAGSAATLLAMIVTRNLVVAMVSGVGTAWAIWLLH